MFVELFSSDGIFEYFDLIFFKICGLGLLDLIIDDFDEEEIDDGDEVDEGGEIDVDVNDEFWENENDEIELDCMFDGDKFGWLKGDDCIVFFKLW